MTGLALASCAAVYLQHHQVPWPALTALAVGAACMWHDRRDFPWTSDKEALFR